MRSISGDPISLSCADLWKQISLGRREPGLYHAFQRRVISEFRQGGQRRVFLSTLILTWTYWKGEHSYSSEISTTVAAWEGLDGARDTTFKDCTWRRTQIYKERLGGRSVAGNGLKLSLVWMPLANRFLQRAPLSPSPSSPPPLFFFFTIPSPIPCQKGKKKEIKLKGDKLADVKFRLGRGGLKSSCVPVGQISPWSILLRAPAII